MSSILPPTGNIPSNLSKVDKSDSTSLYEEEELYKTQMKKISHNEAEKKRIKTINKYIDDIRTILDEAKISHKSDKVSTLEAAITYIKKLLRERDRLTSTLGYMDTLNPRESPPPDDYEPDDLTSETISQPTQYTYANQSNTVKSTTSTCSVTSPSGSVYTSMPPPTSSCSSTYSNKYPLREAAVESLDYRQVWMNNNIATVVVHIETGQLLKGNNVFMQLFHFHSIQELNKLSLFDIIVVNDLSLFWSEYSQLVNCNSQIIRSFVVTVTNPSQDVSIPCLITMGPIMDYEGYVFQVSASFMPVKLVNSCEDSRVSDPIGKNAVSLEKII